MNKHWDALAALGGNEPDETTARDRETTARDRETTARGRAVEVLESRIERGQIRDIHLHNAIRALLPDLRVLAGAPTADVAEERVAVPRVHLQRWAEHLRTLAAHAIRGLNANDAALDTAARIEFWASARPAAPEGVDAADEQGDDLIRRATKYHHAHLRAHGDEQAAMAATLHVFNLHRAPEGVDVADEQRSDVEDVQDLAASTSRICAALGVETEDDGWADDAVREVERLARELTAAQAAIQRVRYLHRPWPGAVSRYCRACADHVPCSTVRALDGDATEEG